MAKCKSGIPLVDGGLNPTPSARKEVEFDGGKVLVARLGDRVVATSAYCTHYGAPLARGVLTADGRVVCPW